MGCWQASHGAALLLIIYYIRLNLCVCSKNKKNKENPNPNYYLESEEKTPPTFTNLRDV